MSKTPLLCLLLALLLPLCLQAAQAPDWLTPFLGPETRTWSKRPTVCLLNQVELRYTNINTCVERRLGAYLLNEQNRGLVRPPLPLTYQGNTDKILKLLVWTVAPDGSVKNIPRSELTERSSTSQLMRYSGHQLSYHLAELAPGTIIAWDFELERATGPLDTFSWLPYRGFPVYKASFKALPPPEGQFLYKRGGGETGSLDALPNEGVSWSLEKLKVPSSDRPGGFLPERPFIALRCLPKTGNHADSDDWEGLSKAFYDLFDDKLASTPELQAIAEKLVAGKTERWSRIRALADFVQGEISYLSQLRETDYLAGCRPQAAAECLKNRFGDCKDKATLFKALMACIGEEAHIVLLFTNDPTHVKPDWPSNTFNHAINAIPAGEDAPAVYPITQHPRLGRLVILDTTMSTGNLGVLPLQDQLGHALLCHPDRGGLFRLPGDSEATLSKLSTHIRFDATGKADIERVETSTGQMAVLEHRLRDKVAADQVRSALEGRYNAAIPSPLRLEFKQAWDATNLRYELSVHFQAEELLRKAAKDLFLFNPTFAQTAAPLPPWNTEAPGVAMQPYLCIDEEVFLELPPDHVLAEAPAPELVRADKGSYVARIDLEGRTLRVHTHYTQQAGLYSKAEYTQLRDLRQRWLAAQRRPVVLKLVPGGRS